MLLELKNEITYGPINSRRLGRSLGINLFPGSVKVCTFDCIYCQFGFADPVTPRDRRNSDCPSVAEVIGVVEEALEGLEAKPDYLTFSGNGEPTLHPEFGTIVEGLIQLRDRHSPTSKTAILSNSSMVCDRSIRRALERLDVRIMKLDAGNEDVFRIYNRPARGLTLDDITDGLSLLGDVTIQTLFTGGVLARTSHHPSTATADLAPPASLRFVDQPRRIAENTPSTDLGRRPCRQHHLGRFATKADKKTGLGNNGETDIRDWIKRLKRISPIMVQVYTLDRESPSRLISKLTFGELEGICERVRDAGIVAEAFDRQSASRSSNA